MNWLILRGLVREQRHWGDFRGELEESLRAHRADTQVHALDFPGFGSEASRESPYSIDAIVDDLRGRWLALSSGSNQKWGLLAVSLGGMVAMNWTSRYPMDFGRLVLINSSATGLSPLYKRLKPENYPAILSLFAEKDIARREKRILELTTNLRGADLDDRAKKHASFALKVRKKDALAQIVAAIRFRPPLRIETPVLVLASKGDQLVDYSCSEQIALRFKGKLELNDHANHDLPLDDPKWVIGHVTSWLA